MELIKSIQEADVGILNKVLTGWYNWIQLNMTEGYLWSLRQVNNNNS